GVLYMCCDRDRRAVMCTLRVCVLSLYYFSAVCSPHFLLALVCWCPFLSFCSSALLFLYFFFFQAEDGIRDWSVTGVQTCALPISNDYHGAAYEFLRNDKTDARSFFSPGKAPLRYNIFGTSVGGPIRRDKTFLDRKSVV